MKNWYVVSLLVLLGFAGSYSAPAQANAICAIDSDCGHHGSCNGGECHCDDGYTTHGDGPVCGYQQKSRLTALLLQIFVGQWGAGEFYLKKYNYAVPQLFLGMTAWGTLGLSVPAFAAMLGCYGMCICAMDESACWTGISGCGALATGMTGAALVTGSLIASTAMGAWWVVDIVRIASGAAKDNNGEETAW